MDIKTIFSQFETNCNYLNCQEFGDGNIHKTWKINTVEGPSFILQKFNDYVFKDPIGLMGNTFVISNHLSLKIAKNNLKWEYPSFYKTKESEFLHREEDESYWRLMDYIDHDAQAAVNDQRYYKAGVSYGQFIELLSDLPAELIIETIPDFHNLTYRLENFKEAIKSTSDNLRNKSEPEIKSLLEKEKRMLHITKLRDSGRIPIRLVHMDTKLDNILFDSMANPVAIIDLDTVMPGIVHSDFGDAMRSFGNTMAEDERDLSKVSFSLDIFTDYTRGFATSLKNLLLPAEIESLHLAPGMFAYMQAMRFLDDYLLGSKYYTIKYAEHNMIRARNQIHLLEDIERKENEMSRIVKREFNL